MPHIIYIYICENIQTILCTKRSAINKNDVRLKVDIQTCGKKTEDYFLNLTSIFTYKHQFLSINIPKKNNKREL